MVYGIALTHTGNRSDAEDVFQEVFLVYHRKQPSLEGDERCKAWLITTTLNCARQLTASSWRRKVVPLYESTVDGRDEERDGDRFAFRTEEQDAVFAALQQLPRKYRSVLHLFYFEDMSVAQIALALGIEAGTVKVQLSRGRAQMRERLKGEYFDE
jgi:RNA polymerase sigma-70 factor (ECF subfamily)